MKQQQDITKRLRPHLFGDSADLPLPILFGMLENGQKNGRLYYGPFTFRFAEGRLMGAEHTEANGPAPKDLADMVLAALKTPAADFAWRSTPAAPAHAGRGARVAELLLEAARRADEGE